jgi:hypothetical protein
MKTSTIKQSPINKQLINTDVNKYVDIIKTHYTTKFNDLYKKFLTSLIKVFPECSLLKKTIEEQPLTLSNWYNQTNKFFSTFIEKNNDSNIAKFYQTNPFFKKINFHQKWIDPGFSNKNKQHTIKYIKYLNLYSNLVMNVQVFPDLINKLSNDDLNLNLLNGNQLSIMTNITSIVFKLANDNKFKKSISLLQRTFYDSGETINFCIGFLKIDEISKIVNTFKHKYGNIIQMLFSMSSIFTNQQNNTHNKRLHESPNL